MRQEVTNEVRAIASGCPVSSGDFEVMSKSARAVILDRLVGSATNEPLPAFDLSEYTDSHLVDYFISLAHRSLLERCMRGRFGERDLEVYSAALDLDPDWPASHKASQVIGEIDSFLLSGVGFSTTLLALAESAAPNTHPGLLYEKLIKSYGPMAKKFTSGKSFHKLNMANMGIMIEPDQLTDYVAIGQLGDPIRTSPGIIEAAAGCLEDSDRLSYLKSETGSQGDKTALCLASIEVSPERPSTAEMVWQWTIGTARNSALIERARELS